MITTDDGAYPNGGGRFCECCWMNLLQVQVDSCWDCDIGTEFNFENGTVRRMWDD